VTVYTGLTSMMMNSSVKILWA